MTPLVTVQPVRAAFDQGESGLSWHRASNVSPAMRLCWGSGIPKALSISCASSTLAKKRLPSVRRCRHPHNQIVQRR